MNEVTIDRINSVLPMLDERQRRLYLAKEAQGIGFGGISAVSELTGTSRTTITTGIKEVESLDTLESNRIRKAGGGRKAVEYHFPEIKIEIEKIVSNQTFGNPENPLTYTTQSLIKIKEELNNKSYKISTNVISDILKELGYSLQLNQKCLQVGRTHPDRNTQFEFINGISLEFMISGEPVISVDTKKKELIGNYKNNGSEYREKKNPRQVIDHDFATALGKVVPYGVYDVNQNEGFVNLGISADTAEFAIESILRWWQTLGKKTYPNATKLLITPDAGGSNGYRVRLWKLQLQELANTTGLEIHVSHFPPGTSKWNKIEHRMFCYISKSWRGQPLISVETVISLIGNTTTTKGLTITCIKDDKTYELGKKVSDIDFEKINIKKEEICPDWNYIISPNSN